jgi:hypothetical protein
MQPYGLFRLRLPIQNMFAELFGFINLSQPTAVFDYFMDGMWQTLMIWEVSKQAVKGNLGFRLIAHGNIDTWQLCQSGKRMLGARILGYDLLINGLGLFVLAVFEEVFGLLELSRGVRRNGRGG